MEVLIPLALKEQRESGFLRSCLNKSLKKEQMLSVDEKNYIRDHVVGKGSISSLPDRDENIIAIEMRMV